MSDQTALAPRSGAALVITAPAVPGGSTEETGTLLGQTLAVIVIGNLRAAEAGWERGYLYEHTATYPATYPAAYPTAAEVGADGLCVVPEQFTQFAAHAATYRDAFAEGRADYRTDHKLPAPLRNH